ncbi:unnamed protein product, partial [Heterosigma akashiwo]
QQAKSVNIGEDSLVRSSLNLRSSGEIPWKEFFALAFFLPAFFQLQRDLSFQTEEGRRNCPRSEVLVVASPALLLWFTGPEGEMAATGMHLLNGKRTLPAENLNGPLLNGRKSPPQWRRPPCPSMRKLPLQP